MTWTQHKEDWCDCSRCAIAGFRTNVVLGRGRLPCDILLIGEAPGVVEDVTGAPFKGMAGRLLDQVLAHAAKRIQFSYFITNIVACRPCDKAGGSNRAPTEDEVSNCAERLNQCVVLARPKGVIVLGNTAERGFVNRYGILTRKVPHPAFINYNGGVKSAMYPNYCKSFAKAVTELLKGDLYVHKKANPVDEKGRKLSIRSVYPRRHPVHD